MTQSCCDYKRLHVALMNRTALACKIFKFCDHDTLATLSEHLFVQTTCLVDESRDYEMEQCRDLWMFPFIRRWQGANEESVLIDVGGVGKMRSHVTSITHLPA